MKKLAINPSNKKYYSDDYIKGWEDGVNAQYEATKDAVEVVRCKDCKYFEYNHTEVVDGVPLILAHEICAFWGGGSKTSENGYCSFGERKEQNDE